MIRFLLAVAGMIAGLVLVLPAILLALPFWIVSGLTRGLHALVVRVGPTPLTWDQMIEFAPEVGWRSRPNLHARGRADGVFRVTTDADGWRGAGSIEEAKVVVVGDSFAFGYGIDDRDLYLRHAGGVRVKAIGTVGYNMVHELIWMRRVAERLSGKLVIWFIYHGNDPYENLCPNLDHYRMPFVRRRNEADSWEIVTEHVTAAPWTTSGKRPYLRRLAEFSCPGPFSDRVWSACEFLVAQGRDLCAAARARLVVITIPDPSQLGGSRLAELSGLAPPNAAFDVGLPDRRVRELCVRLGVTFVPLAEHLDSGDYKRNDVHWNSRGHRRVGALIASLAHRSPHLPEHQAPVDELDAAPAILRA